MAAFVKEFAFVFKTSHFHCRYFARVARQGRPRDKVLLQNVLHPVKPDTAHKAPRVIADKTNIPEPEEEQYSVDDSIVHGPEEIVIEASKQNPAFVDGSHGDQGSFKSIGLRDDVIAALEGIEVRTPTIIQMNAIPKILLREHVICAAQTGSGKTLAYLAPIINHLKSEETLHGISSRAHRPRACVVVPSRTSSASVVAKSLSHHVKFSSMGLIGGRKTKWMKESLGKQMDLVISTPGTLLKYREKGELFFSDLSYLVIDEADTMFDHSFEELTTGLLDEMTIRAGAPPSTNKLPIDTQVTVVCATLPEKLINKTLKDIIPISTSGLHKVLPHIKHSFVKILQEHKADKLLKMLRSDARAGRCTMVFCNTTQSCNWLSFFLNNNNIEHIRLNGEIPPEIRSHKYSEILEGKVKVMLCTDIASRGLDTTEVSHVINFDFPTTAVDYIHRVGRTGRVRTNKANTSAQATSLVTHKRDVRLAMILEMAAKRIHL